MEIISGLINLLFYKTNVPILEFYSEILKRCEHLLINLLKKHALPSINIACPICCIQFYQLSWFFVAKYLVFSIQFLLMLRFNGGIVFALGSCVVHIFLVVFFNVFYWEYLQILHFSCVHTHPDRLRGNFTPYECIPI